MGRLKDYRDGFKEWAGREKMDMETQVRQALARGYCHPKNSAKELDAELIEAMAQEVVKALTPEVMPGHQ